MTAGRHARNSLLNQENMNRSYKAASIHIEYILDDLEDREKTEGKIDYIFGKLERDRIILI